MFEKWNLQSLTAFVFMWIQSITAGAVKRVKDVTKSIKLHLSRRLVADMYRL
jgi:hypothetical protein